MKISASPLAVLIANAEKKITDRFIPNTMDITHDRKRQLAESVIAGVPATAEFGEAASIEGMTVMELATLIVSKPNALMQIENLRRMVIIQVRACSDQSQIDEVLAQNGVSIQYFTIGK